MLLLRTLGGLALETEGTSVGTAAQRAPLAMLAFIAAAGDTGASRDRIALLFWPESDAEHARGSLKQALYTLRRSLNRVELTLGTTSLKLNPDLIHTDIGDFRAAIGRKDWESAVATYGGPFLDGIHLASNSEFERWVDRERAVLAEQHSAALESLARNASSRGEYTKAVEWWRRLATTDMLSARIACGYMNALADSGNREGAVKHAHLYETMVRSELETEPDPSVAALAREIQVRAAKPPDMVPRSITKSPPESAGIPAPETSRTETTAGASVLRPLVQRSANARRWIASGVVAVAVGGYLLLAAKNTAGEAEVSSGAFARNDQILVGDFEAQPGDSLTARALTEVLRGSLGNTRAVIIVSRAEIDQALRLMQLPVTARLDHQLVHDLAERNGYEAILSGTLTPVAKGYVLSARLTTPQGRELATLSETAASGDDLIPAVSRISKSLRRRIGESKAVMDSVRSLPPLTTRSLAALKLFQQAQDETRAGKGQAPRTITLLREAVAQDSTFAMAHRFLGIKLSNNGSVAEGIGFLRRAERFSDRLTDLERLTVLSSLHLLLLDYSASADEAERVLEMRPTSLWALNQLGILYNLLGRHEHSREMWLRMGEQDPTGWTDFAVSAILQGRHQDALAWGRAFYSRHKDSAGTRASMNGRSRLATIHAAGFSYDSAEYYSLPRGESDPGNRDVLALSRLSRGQIGRAFETWGVRSRGDDGGRLSEQSSFVTEALAAAATSTLSRDRNSASRRLDAVLADTAYRNMFPADRPITPVVALVLAGRVADAGRELAAIQNALDADMRLARAPQVSLARGALALAENRIPESIAELEQSRSKFMITWEACRVCPLPWLGRAYEAANRPDSAIAVYERYLSTGDYNRRYVDAIWRPVVLRRAADLHAQRGDSVRAVQRLRQFVELWQNADRELQPQVTVARRRIAALETRAQKNSLPPNAPR